MEAIEKNAVVNGTRITYFERGIAYRGQGPTLLFVHATGFHARVWDKIINALGDFHSISLDQRGHGRSEKVSVSHWNDVITDTFEFVEQLDLTNIVAIGHSMGGQTTNQSAIGRGWMTEDDYADIDFGSTKSSSSKRKKKSPRAKLKKR